MLEKQGHCCDLYPTVVQKPSGQFAGEGQKGLKMPARGALEYCEQNFMDDSGRNSGDKNADRNVDSKDQAYEVSDGKEDSARNWTRAMCVTVCKEFVHLLAMF